MKYGVVVCIALIVVIVVRYSFTPLVGRARASPVSNVYEGRNISSHATSGGSLHGVNMHTVASSSDSIDTEAVTSPSDSIITQAVTSVTRSVTSSPDTMNSEAVTTVKNRTNDVTTLGIVGSSKKGRATNITNVTCSYWTKYKTISVTHRCGWCSDCPLKYSLVAVNKTADSLHTRVGALAKQNEVAHTAASAACNAFFSAAHGKQKVTSEGGYCYTSVGAKVVKKDVDMQYLLPDGHVLHDIPIMDTLLNHVLLKQDGSCCQSISDFGAGVGQLGHALKARKPSIEYYGYDGAGNVEEFTKNYIKFADLSKPLSVKRTDWVISLEVGEHIPNAYEEHFITNLHAHNCKGIVLSWAILEQDGKAHINCHSKDFLLEVFEGLGYRLNRTLQTFARGRKLGRFRNKYMPGPYCHPWFWYSLLVFERITKPASCPESEKHLPIVTW